MDLTAVVSCVFINCSEMESTSSRKCTGKG